MSVWHADSLAEHIIGVAHKLHPEYSHAQCLIWACGFLATVVYEKNHMDNIVYQNLNARLSQLLAEYNNNNG